MQICLALCLCRKGFPSSSSRLGEPVALYQLPQAQDHVACTSTSLQPSTGRSAIGSLTEPQQILLPEVANTESEPSKILSISETVSPVVRNLPGSVPLLKKVASYVPNITQSQSLPQGEGYQTQNYDVSPTLAVPFS